jgi:hypothetical protein
MIAASVAFVGAVVHAVPALRPILQEHLDDQEGEVLPHLLMADLERWLEREVKERPVQSAGDIQGMLQFIEESFTAGDPKINEVISASFLEHFPRPGEVGSEIRGMVGPALREQLRIIG